MCTEMLRYEYKKSLRIKHSDFSTTKINVIDVISNPNVAAPGGTPLQKVQAAAAGDSITTAYTLTVTASNGTADTFTTAQTSSGRWIVADSAGNIISFPT